MAKHSKELITGNISLESVNASEQMRIKTQMEHILRKLQPLITLISDPAFDKYKKPSDTEGNIYWTVGLVQGSDGQLITVPDQSSAKDNHLSISNQENHLSVDLHLHQPLPRKKLGAPLDYGGLDNPTLPDPVTGESIVSLSVEYEGVAKLGSWLKQLLTPDHLASQAIAFDMMTHARIPEFRSNYPDLFDPTTLRHYRTIYSASSDTIHKGMKVFEEFPLQRRDDEDLMGCGFPPHQFFPITDKECLQRIDTLLAFILPPLIQEKASVQNELPSRHNLALRRISQPN